MTGVTRTPKGDEVAPVTPYIVSKYETTDNKARQLLEGGGAVRCNELTAALKSLGFNVKDASSGGYKNYDYRRASHTFMAARITADTGKTPK